MTLIPDIEIRNCRNFNELDACVQLQIEVWGYAGGDVVPRREFLVAQKIGGQVIGAFNKANGDLLGFAMALPGVHQARTGEQTGENTGRPHAYLHSHMLAVRSGLRNLGLGTRLKLAQRVEALSRGIRLMEWTFDPLEIKNAFLNIHKLGAIVRRYETDFYGVSSSRLQSGLPTDRLVAEWHLDSPRVEDALIGAHRLLRPVEEIQVPSAIYQWKESDRERHRAYQILIQNREAFQRAFLNGLAVSGFSCDDAGNGIFALEKADSCELSHEAS